MADAPTPPPAAGSSPEDRLHQARIAYVQMKTCTVLSLIFAACGVFVFIRLYNIYIAPDPWVALRDAGTMGMVLTAFIPAIILSFFARKHEKKYLALMQG
jgi:hypothetical protein